MYTLAAYCSSSTFETWEYERKKNNSSPKLSRFGSFNLGNWKTGKSGCIGSVSPTINSYRKSMNISNKGSAISSSNTINKSSSSSSGISSSQSSTISSSSKNSNSSSSSIKSSWTHNKKCVIHKVILDRPSLDSSVSSVDEDEDLYDFDIYEDERRYKPILKHTSKYGPIPPVNSPKTGGLWRLFGSYRKLPQGSSGQPTTTTTSSGGRASAVAVSPDSAKTKQQWSDVWSKINGYEKPMPESPKLKDSRENSLSDGGYCSDDGVISDWDWDHFQLTQSLEKDAKRNVRFSDPLVSHVYKISYKSYIPKDAALVRLKV